MEYKLDDKDWKIISLLQEHADYSTRQMAKRLLMPVTTVHHRIRKLRKQGIIKKFTVELDYGKTGRSFVAYVLISVNLEVLKKKRRTQHDLAREIRRIDEVERVDIVSGGTDMIALVRVKDVDKFDKLLLGRLQLIEGIKNTQSLIVIHAGRI